MNRQQRRTARNGGNVMPDMGTFHRQLPEPVVVGEITAAEAGEIKAMNELIKRLTDEAQHAQRVLNVAGGYRMEFLRRLIDARSLPVEDLYSVDDDSGRITKTHELVKPDLVAVEDVPTMDATDA